MRHVSMWMIALMLAPACLSAGEPKTGADYAEFSRFVTGLVVKQLPRQVEDASAWGQTTEIPDNLRLMRLRKVIKVGNRLEAPHGAWRRFQGKIENPDKDFKLVIKDFTKLNEKQYRIVMDVDVTVMCHGEWQQWQKGLLLVGAEATADANITAAIVCDVATSINFKTFPPELKLEPKIAELGLTLVDAKLRGGPILTGEKGKALADDFKDVLRTLVKASEPAVQVFANHALERMVKDGRGSISATAVLKALPAVQDKNPR